MSTNLRSEPDAPGAGPASGVPARVTAGERLKRRVWIAAALVAVITVVLGFLQFRVPGHGFTYVLDFGETIGLPRIPEVEALPVYIHKDVPGYDAQFYAQLAVDPTCRRPDLDQHIDNLPYRGRRLLMGLVAWCIGLGDPWRILNVYACINLATWLALGVVLMRWFPPVGPLEFVRWAGVLFSAGALSSLRHSLTDGPALLVIALMMGLVEARRPWAAAACGVLAPLTRETCLLVVAAFAPERWTDWRRWTALVLRVSLVVLPFAVWVAVLSYKTGGLANAAGHRNFDLPFRAYASHWAEILEPVIVDGSFPAHTRYAVLAHVALTVQAAFIVLRPRWGNAWWRLGAVHVVLMGVLGGAVWEGFPGAAARVLLPLQLCFNVLAGAGTRWGVVVLIAGNLSIFTGAYEMSHPPQPPIWSIVPSTTLREAVPNMPPVTIRFIDGFYGQEGSGSQQWRWTNGNALLGLSNHSSAPVRVKLRLSVAAPSRRRVTVSVGGLVIGSGEAGLPPASLECQDIVIPRGETVFAIDSGPSGFIGEDDRPLGAGVYEIDIRADVASAEG